MPDDPSPTRTRAYVPAVGPGLKKLLHVVLALFAILAINGVYLLAITIAEQVQGQVLQNHFYLLMFLAHIVLGALLIGPFLFFGIVHTRNTIHRKNRRAVRAGIGLFAAGIVLVASGVVLVRIEGVLEVRDPEARSIAYWAHVLSPLLVAWLFILHRLAGPKIQWKVGGWLAAATLVFAIGMVSFHGQDPRQWNEVGPDSGEQYFFPSLARTATGNFIPAETLMMDQYCKECHADVHSTWESSVHRFASFNNPAYRFSVRETRQVALDRDGDVQASRFCAGCHDLVPFFSGAFDNPDFDDENDPTASAGITCTGCHAITHINSLRGNADFTIDEPPHYPFTYSDSPLLQWVNRQLVKAKPSFHKKTFLKPLHKTAEFCGACHKVHLPEELNKYKWLRGQNHYDSYHRSGVSGHGVESFYYPPKAEHNCNGCHMPLQASDDFGARDFDGSGTLSVHDHQFPSANTAIPHLLGLGAEAIAAHEEFSKDTVRVDLFALRRGGEIDGELMGPIRPALPELIPGERYLLEAVVRTLKLGHLFTEGTGDSNQVWLDLTVKSGDRIIGRSGAIDDQGLVDPWSHFLNSYVLDKNGDRIDRRNAQDIAVALYNHQIPPGAADVIHYGFTVPADAEGPITLSATLRYRKFDTTYMRYVFGDAFEPDLPIMDIGSDTVTLPLARSTASDNRSPGDGSSGGPAVGGQEPPILWQRWNDYGIGLLRKGDTGSSKGQLRQAEEAFLAVEQLGVGDGALNRARVYLKEGRLDEAVTALQTAGDLEQPAAPWSVAWFTGICNQENGHLDEALLSFRSVLETRFQGAVDREFDFSQDYKALNTLGVTLYERAKEERGDSRKATRDAFLNEARATFERALELDPENVTSHYNLALLHTQLGDQEAAQVHRDAHRRYKPDDNARDRAVQAHRAKNEAADHAAEAVVIYDIQRPGTFGLPPESNDGR